VLVNLSNETVCIENGDRIAQLVFAKIECIDWVEANNTDNTERGAGGFGSTGIK
jgi:dUTP pyrophosphatase